MKLIIKKTERGQLALHTESGECLPMQSSLVIQSEPDCLNTVTVVFLLTDGGELYLDDSAK